MIQRLRRRWYALLDAMDERVDAWLERLER